MRGEGREVLRDKRQVQRLKERGHRGGGGGEREAKWMDVWWFTVLWSDRKGSGCVKEVMEEMICETLWWVEFHRPHACQHGLPLTAGSPNSCEAHPKPFWEGDLKPWPVWVHMHASTCACVYAPYISTWLLCTSVYLQLPFHMWVCICVCEFESDSRWTKDVQQSQGPAVSNCTEYSVYYQQHDRFKATCSPTVSITVTIHILCLCCYHAL